MNAAKSAQQQQLHAVIEQERGSIGEETGSLPSSSSGLTQTRSLDPVRTSDYQKNEAPLSAVINMVRLQGGGGGEI